MPLNESLAKINADISIHYFCRAFISDAPFWFGGIPGIVSAVIIAVILGKNSSGKASKHDYGEIKEA